MCPVATIWDTVVIEPVIPESSVGQCCYGCGQSPEFGRRTDRQTQSIPKGLRRDWEEDSDSQLGRRRWDSAAFPLTNPFRVIETHVSGCLDGSSKGREEAISRNRRVRC